MIRATTPKHIFIFENDPTNYARILITYSADGKIVLEKEKEDLTFEDYTEECSCGQEESAFAAWFRLTQEETRRFSPNKPIRVQVRVLTTSGEALASDMKSITIRDVLNDEVLV